MSDIIRISKVGLYETVRCAICKNPNQTERGCDGACQVDKELHEKIVEAVIGIAEPERPHGTCKTCKHYIPYKEQFSYRNRGDGYCKSTITTSEGNAYINCHDEWYCANYEKEGGAT